jgi:RimJ/RimL family protein N-acetyltransferase
MSQIIYQGKTKTGQDILLRYPTIEDTAEMLQYINTLSLEKSYIRMQGEQFTFQEEEQWLKSIIAKIESATGITHLAIIDNKIVGVCDINLKGLVEKHIGLFGLTIAKEYREEGIGTLLTDQTIKAAMEKIPDMKIIELGVFGDNPIAIRLYKKFGFKEYGRLPEGILHLGKFVDHIYMYKQV